MRKQMICSNNQSAYVSQAKTIHALFDWYMSDLSGFYNKWICLKFTKNKQGKILSIQLESKDNLTFKERVKILFTGRI